MSTLLTICVFCVSFVLLQLDVVRSECPGDNVPPSKLYPPCSSRAKCLAAQKGKKDLVAEANACVPLWAYCYLTVNPHKSNVAGCVKGIQAASAEARHVADLKEYNAACKAMGSLLIDGAYLSVDKSSAADTSCPCRKDTGTGGTVLTFFGAGTAKTDGHYIICNPVKNPLDTARGDTIWNALKIKDGDEYVPHFCTGTGNLCNDAKKAGKECNTGDPKPYQWPPGKWFESCCPHKKEDARPFLYPVIADAHYNKEAKSGIEFMCACGPMVAHAAVIDYADADADVDAHQQQETIERLGEDLFATGFQSGWKAGLKLNRMKHEHGQKHRRNTRGDQQQRRSRRNNRND